MLVRSVLRVVMTRIEHGDKGLSGAMRQELLAEQFGAPMAIAEQGAWRDTKQMRPLSLPGSAELPKAIARSNGIARLPGGGDSTECHRHHRRGDA